LRAPVEIGFRARQELKNICLWARPPAREFDPKVSPHFAAPDGREVARALAGTRFARDVVALSRQIRQHRFPVFGVTVDTGPEIRWRRDYQRGIETSPNYFRRIPYLNVGRAGDHKFIWELNRHQHLVTLAQAYLFTRDAANLDEIRAQLESWFAQNPFARGINWASALEAAFRALSWIWTYHFVGQTLPADFRARWLQELYRHGCYLENNLSVYFSPNTHLLGEALALHALGLFFAGLPKAARWEQLGAGVMREQMERQVHSDGSHIERSTYYHVYALDMFLLHAILARPDRSYLDKLARMAEYLDAMLGPSRRLPFLGDDDGGRLFHPDGPRDRFGASTIATASIILDRHQWHWSAADLHQQAAWWLGCGALTHKPGEGKCTSRLFLNAGVAVMVSGDKQVIADAGPFGPWGAGHSHADALSIVARAGDEEILIDPGTYTYVGDARQRDRFRGTAAHNTIRIDGLDQATAAGPFRWKNHPQVSVRSWETNAQRDLLDAECHFAGFTHRRRVEFQKPDLVVIIDDIEGPPGEHDVEQFWHLGSPEAQARISLPEGAELAESWRSSMFGEKHPAPMLVVRRRSNLPLRLEARIRLNR
jgi:hypothetical protein